VLVQDIAAKKDNRFFRMGKHFRHPRRQVANAQLQALRGQQEHLPAEAGDRQLVQGNESQLVNELPGDHGPVRRGIQLGGC
jgi:hypothetical protein